MDLREHRLVHEGSLVWKLNKKLIEVYVVLFEDIVVLFQKQDDKLVLRYQSAQLVHGYDPTICPIIVNDYLMVKQVAAGACPYITTPSVLCGVIIFY